MLARDWRRYLTIVLLASLAAIPPTLCAEQPRTGDLLSGWRRRARAPQQPVAGETPQQPVAGETPQQPVAGETPQQPVAGEPPRQPVAGEAPMRSVAGETPGPAKLAAGGDSSDKADKNIAYLNKDHDLWIDKNLKQVVMKGAVAVREGNLEMFACPVQSKEYESIIAVAPRDMSAVHAGLLALGAKPGHPAKFDPNFTAASGTEIDVTVRWTDKQGKPHEARGQDWVRNTKTGKALEYPWVFAGSAFSVNPENGEKRYLANDGDFICVVNFFDSMLDLSIESPKAWSEHVFEPFTQRIPPKGTELELVLTPKPEKK